MEVDQIAQLAAVLRENGDQVLSSKSKLSLSTNLLHNLNDSFAQIIERDASNTSFQVIGNHSIRNETLRDLQFLHDFFQRTVSLKLTPSLLDHVTIDGVDVSKFKNVRLLELNKVSPMVVRGIQAIKTQVQFLVCVRSVCSLGEVLEKCGADDSVGFTWCNLKEANFMHNNLSVIDSCLEFVPWLNILDLSHNQIRDARPINCLTNLKSLNLSYNSLEGVPLFSGAICNRLQVLKINNNFIEDIKEVTVLINLCELDLSNNCLLDHEFLGAVTYLAALQWLNVEGNPLSFHPQHRSKTARYLHSNTSTVRFLLDHSVLRQNEKKLVGSLHPIHSALHTRPHYTSFSSDVSETTMVTSDRQRRVRNAVISEDDELCDDMEASMASIASLVMSAEHLETKLKIEQIRREHGEKWLHSLGGGSMVQDILGLERSGAMASSSPYESDFLIHAKDVDFGAPDKTTSDQEQAFITADSTISETNSIYAVERTLSPELPISDDENLEGEESLFLGKIKGDDDPIFVVVTETHIWERESVSGKETTRWPIELLQSCELLGDNCTDVKLTFDTLRRDRREREYELEVEEATRLSCVLNNILTNRPLEKNNLITYRCMKCSTQFNKEKNSGLDTPVLDCPICFSTVVIEDDENLLPK